MISVAPVILAHHKREDGTYPVTMRITYKRKSKYLATNLVAHEDEVSRTKGSKSAMKIRSRQLENKVALLKIQIDDIIGNMSFFELASMEVEDVVDLVRGKMQGPERFTLNFFAYGYEVAATKHGGTRELYEVALRSFSKFLGTKSYDINAITSRTLKDYMAYLEKHTRKLKDLEVPTTVRSYTKYLGAIYNKARKQFNAEDVNEIPIPRNPFEYIEKPRIQPPRHRNLSVAYIQKMIDMTEDPQLCEMEARALDVFLLGFMLCGMNVVDLFTCEPPKDGILIYNRIKTRNRKADRAEMRVRIEPEMLPLMKKYKDPTGQRAFNFYRIFGAPVYMSISINKGLRKLSVPETFYASRHSWATIAMSKDVKANKSVVNDALTHSDLSMKVTDIYINKDWEVIWETNRKVLDLFDWTPLKTSTSFHRRKYRMSSCPCRPVDGGADSAEK